MRVARYGLLGTFMLLSMVVWAQDEGDSKASNKNLSMEERLQQQMSAKLGNKMPGPKLELGGSLDKKLSTRVEKKNFEINEQLEAQADTVTDVDRAGNKDKGEEKGEQATQTAIEKSKEGGKKGSP